MKNSIQFLVILLFITSCGDSTEKEDVGNSEELIVETPEEVETTPQSGDIPDGDWMSATNAEGENAAFNFDGSEQFDEEDSITFFTKVVGDTTLKYYYKINKGMLFLSEEPNFENIKERDNGDIYEKKF